ncbi:CPBP family intramembrane glutamic endopeptidase [Spelaeicoccus albus]|uniref:Membrane protease YdiL (CAAX protease family) n=1 Tax=Spelaeicoccus albus TaxID=1280376 RepID=A0A7Z0A879_9MICO|nr:CPBP family intramembrane glutamic endopeptidase [Spelaeicoccus albus]NYI66152.1 membrane protease YdiL (CAAX protease family) [Spelaeicoccus albus]
MNSQYTAVPPPSEPTESAEPEVFPARVPWGSVVAFFVIACGLAWLAALPLWLRGHGMADPLLRLFAAIMMYTPAIAALIVVFFVQRPRPTRIGEYLGLWPLRPAKRTIWLAVIAIFGMSAIIVAGVFLAAAFGQIKLDLIHFSGFRQSIAAALNATPGAEHSTGGPALPVGVIVTVQIIAIPFAAIIPNALLTIGEELGWRGWLLPTLRPLGTWPALLVTGAIWGFWHTPLILLGYNFGLTNWYGVLLMIAASMILGILIGWLRLRTASVWPCVFAHGAANAAGGFAGLVVAAGDHPSPIAAGPLGWITWIVMAVVIGILLVTGQFTKQPRLRRRSTPANVIEF